MRKVSLVMIAIGFLIYLVHLSMKVMGREIPFEMLMGGLTLLTLGILILSMRILNIASKS